MGAGRPIKYNADQLQSLIYGDKGYFKYIEEKPFFKYDVVKTGEYAGTELKVKVPQMPCIETLCPFIKIDRQTWYNWLESAKSYVYTEEMRERGAEDRTKFFDIVLRATDEIQGTQIAGSGAGLYQPMIVARLNKLKDTQEVTQTTIDATDKSNDEIRAAIKAIEDARRNKG